MDARFYNSEDIDIERLAIDLENLYRSQGYQVQHFGSNNQTLVQFKKGGDFEALIGLQAALSLTLQHVSGGTIAVIGQQKWLDKAAVGAIGLVAAPILWPLAFTAGAGAIRQANLSSQMLNMVDSMVRQQRPDVQAGPIPVQFAAQFPQYQQPAQQPYYTPPSPAQPPQQPYYTPPMPAQPPQQPYYAPPQPVQQPPQPPQQYYVPPETQDPPVQSQPKVTMQPAQTSYYTPPVQPTRPEVPPYVPPVTQEPTMQPQPKVTLTASQSAPVQPPPAQPRPQPQYYVPSQTQQPAQQANVSQNAQPAQPLQSHQSSEPSADPNTPWGVLTFSDGLPMQLKGERALIGRYDHDLGGDKPAVDLSAYPGADTTSRMHAVIEHVGSGYTLTDLDSTNATRINGKRLEPERPTPVNNGDTLAFGNVTCTFKKI
jgi:hypothetical protein